jgi:hypothetical protein
LIFFNECDYDDDDDIHEIFIATLYIEIPTINLVESESENEFGWNFFIKKNNKREAFLTYFYVLKRLRVAVV